MYTGTLSQDPGLACLAAQAVQLVLLAQKVIFLTARCGALLVFVLLVLCCQVCDQPHPAIVRTMLTACSEGDLQKAYINMKSLCDMGYSAVDIITTVFKVCATCWYC